MIKILIKFYIFLKKMKFKIYKKNIKKKVYKIQKYNKEKQMEIFKMIMKITLGIQIN